MKPYQPTTGEHCACRPGAQRDNCPDCEGTGRRIDFAAIRRHASRPDPSLLSIPFDDISVRCPRCGNPDCTGCYDPDWTGEEAS